MRATLLLVLAVVSGSLASQAESLREALTLGRTNDEALVASFNKSYDLSPSGTVDHAELITEFRRSVLIVRDRALQGDFAFSAADLAKALVPFTDLVTFVVQARLHPFNLLVREPAYDLYISTGPRSAPIASKSMKRDPVYPPGAGPGSAVVGVRLEASFLRAAIDGAAAPMLILTDEKAEMIWQARLDLSRYR